MKLKRYLAYDVLGHTLAVSVILLAIIITGRFVKYLAEAATGKLAADILLPIMLYRLPGFLELLLPLGLFIGILMAYGRLYVESEMVILSACGVGPGHLARITLYPAIVITVLVALLALFLTPQGAARSEALLNDPQALQGLQFLAAGRFQTRGDDGRVTYAADIDPEKGELQQVFLYDPSPEGDSPSMSITVAQRGQVVRDADNGRRYLELREGHVFSGIPGQADFRIVSFARFGQLLPEDPSSARSEPVDARSTETLLASAAPEDRAALHWRVSLVVMVPIIALLALALSKTNHRQGRYIKLAPALVLHLSYLLSLASVRTRVADGEAGVEEMWLIHAVFFILAMILLFGPSYWRRLRSV